MIRSYSFQNSCDFPMACATFETTAQKNLGTLACSAIYDSFSWNASFLYFLLFLSKRSGLINPTRDTFLTHDIIKTDWADETGRKIPSQILHLC